MRNARNSWVHPGDCRAVWNRKARLEADSNSVRRRHLALFGLYLPSCEFRSPGETARGAARNWIARQIRPQARFCRIRISGDTKLREQDRLANRLPTDRFGDVLGDTQPVLATALRSRSGMAYASRCFRERSSVAAALLVNSSVARSSSNHGPKVRASDSRSMFTPFARR